MLDIVLFFKSVFLIFQLFGKFQRLLEMLNGLSKQLFRLLALSFHRLF